MVAVAILIAVLAGSGISVTMNSDVCLGVSMVHNYHTHGGSAK